MPVQPLPGWHRTSKFLLWGHGLKIPQPRSIAALPPSTEEAGSPLAPQPSANSRHSHRFAPGISDLIDDKVGSDPHARQITHVRVNENTRRIELVIAASMRRLAHRPPRAGGRRVLP